MQLNGEGIGDEDWHQRRQLLEDQLTHFVLEEVEKVDSKEGISAMENVMAEIEEKARFLFDECALKVNEARELRIRQERKKSDQLLDQQIDIPLFPNSIKKQIKNMFLVRNEEEALTIADAMHHFAILAMRDSKDQRKHAQTTWQVFIGAAKQERWDYLQRVATEYRKDLDARLIATNVCPRCNVKLVHQHAQGKEIVRCPHCNSRWMSYKKDEAPIG